MVVATLIVVCVSLVRGMAKTAAEDDGIWSGWERGREAPPPYLAREVLFLVSIVSIVN